ncbi:hypothetical protein SAMN05443245_7437 [Paraburkholderia fungorum]|uniref:Uncharacterized protein n=1 Tax=Paraburkholderia fungorum TaxID=134537 RepID=A0A1H1JXH6_9BURK|nr:hypothetical protein SAMN05443245_7437 [Paraburkholderia fungorum]
MVFGAMVERLVEAYYGLSTWEPYPGTLGQLKSLLLQDNQTTFN